MGGLAVQTGQQVVNGNRPENPMILMPFDLVARENVGSCQGRFR